MKKTQLSWLLAFMMLVVTNFGFTSCSDDDDDEVSSDAIVGTWNYSSCDGVALGETYTQEEMGIDDLCKTMKFNSDGSFEVDGDAAGTWTLKGETLTLTETGSDPMVFTAEISGKKLTLSYSEDVSGFTVTVYYYFTK